MGERDVRKANKHKNIVKEQDLTYDNYAAMDDGNRYELVKGQLELMSPSPSVTHQLTSSELQKAIAQSCESDYFILNAPIDVILSPVEEVRQPDLVLIHRSRIDLLSNRGVEGAPDLVVEILSPSSLKRDKIDKLETYARYRIPEYWIVEPSSGMLEQYTLQDNQYTIFNVFQGENTVTSPNLPCVSFTMAAIMRNIPDLEN